MRKSEWNDEQLKELLSQLPKVGDHRTPIEIYQNIAIKLNRRKQRMWILPSAAAAAAVLLFFILVPNLINWQGIEEKAKNDASEQSTSAPELVMEKRALVEKDNQNAEARENQIAMDTKEQEEGKAEISITSMDMADQATAVYDEDVVDKEVLTYGIPDPNVEFLVPVSILIPKEGNKSKFELFSENMARLTEEEWGLTDYFPLDANLTFDEKSRILSLDVPADHSYSLSSTTETLLQQVLNHTMETLNVHRVNLTTEGKPGIDFSHFGHIDHFENADQQGREAYYFYFPFQNVTKPFLVPLSIIDKKGSIKEAFSAMRTNQKGKKLLASIPESMQFVTEEKPGESKLVIRFDKGSNLANDDITLHTIEAILLTAKEFNYDVVKLENANIDKIGRFDLNQEIKVPVAANKETITNE
ncbi:hypothetical protein F7731_02000 [Cytobacillus depressus]|uniref:Negative regulator of sigma-X activity n=1 Tax=Cytobacillus depressus TaxID=1602942 RepID=A0A6L3V9J9_9BACI|nr:hypothetical protein [Cytobacillus depressus]KAB2338361.1 hypothetical protein F7731_02000 [Cytobacillus depressus]